MRKLIQNRYGGVVIFYLIFLVISLVTRLALLIFEIRSVDHNPLNLLGVLLCGTAFDVAAASYASLPLIGYLLLAPRRWLASRAHRILACAFCFGLLYLLLFGVVSEWLFWEEFESRFNFIAVDYLVYTTEVVGNIRESYPMPAILGGLLLGAGGLFWGLWKTRLLQRWFRGAPEDGGRFGRAAALAAVSVLCHFTLSNRAVPEFGNTYNQELARNGLYSFFAAYRENELSYDRFYPTLPEEDVLAKLRPLLAETNAEFVSPDPARITRRVRSAGPEKHWNVIQITVESLSAKYLGAFGHAKDITPNLDRLYEESLVFTNLYATGTRTVRGMESLALSVPPTPGQSIVRRPHNENLFSLGALFRGRGYDTAFIYSGFGYFDNMNDFFAANGYRVIDRATVSPQDVTYATVWGACDEDLYRWTLREADQAFAAGKPFHYFLMTTSNHRPYGFPAGKIDLPPGRRLSAVKYTDYAIGEMLRQARTRPWFTNTVFLIVADHCASASGKTTIPINGYHIPAFIWNPALVPPQKAGQLCSQIDLPPTLLGLMGWSYETRFFGRNVLTMRPAEERAFISTYQKLGYFRDGKMAVLQPMRRQNQFAYELPSGDMQPVPADPEFINEAVAFYQGASFLFTQGLNRADLVNAAPAPLKR